METDRTRYLEPLIRKDLAKKMVFLGGPRQVGKTTLARAILGEAEERYFNWDYDEDRERILRRQWPAGPGLLVFDERATCSSGATSSATPAAATSSSATSATSTAARWTSSSWRTGSRSSSSSASPPVAACPGGLRYLKQRFPRVEAWQLTAEVGVDRVSDEEIRTTSILSFLGGLV